MVANPDQMRFSGASIDLLREIKYAASRRVTDRALEFAMRQGREVVTEEDVMAVLRSALDDFAAEQVQSGDATASEANVEIAAR